MIQELTDRELFMLESVAPSFHQECGLPGTMIFPIFKKNWETFMRNGVGTIFVLLSGGKMTGAIGALIYPDVCDDVLVATEMFWYVLPEHRHGLGPIQLLKKLESWAKAKGAKRLLMAAFMNEHHDRVQSLYQRVGFKPVETYFCKIL